MSVFNACTAPEKTNNILESVINTYNSFDTLEEGVFKYTASMIPVLAKRTAEGTKYLVEFDMLRKLSNNSDCTIVESFNCVCNENSIDPNDVYIYVSESTYNAISEAVYFGTETGSSISINYGINALSECGVNILAIEEGLKFNPIKFDSLCSNPKLKEIKGELKYLSNAYSLDGEAVYKERKTIFKTILKIIRWLNALGANIGEILTFINIPVCVGLIASGKAQFSPVSFIVATIKDIIRIIVSKLIVFAIDKSEETEIRTDCLKIIDNLERMKSNIDNEEERKFIDKQIEEINKIVSKLK